MTWPERRHRLPDGREIRSGYGGALDGWSVRLAGPEGAERRAPIIHDALADLLDVGPGRRPAWFAEAAAGLTARDTEAGRAFPCPCCEHLTLGEPPNGTFEICDVCFWEDDAVQLRHPDCETGANRVSLLQARATYRDVGVSDPRFGRHVRPPAQDEVP